MRLGPGEEAQVQGGGESVLRRALQVWQEQMVFPKAAILNEKMLPKKLQNKTFRCSNKTLFWRAEKQQKVRFVFVWF